jgi:hypothetical protein
MSNRSGTHTLFNRSPYTTAGRQIEGYGIQSAVMKVRPHDMLHPLAVCNPGLLSCCAPLPPVYIGAHARYLLVPRRHLLLPLP